MIAEYDGAGNLLAEYVYANGQRIAKMNPDGTIDYYLNDHLGSARAMAGSGWSANYYPFGEIASQTGSEEHTHFDFTGQERDHGTGLIYFGARYYDPAIGRWFSVDPLAEKYPSLSPYNYAANNPIRLIDPDGRRLYDSMGNRINLNQTLSLFNQGVNAFFSGNQQNAMPNFYAKQELSDLWDTEDWRHGQMMTSNSILVGNYKLYDSQSKSLKSMSAIYINYASQGGLWNYSKIEFVAYTKNGEPIYRFLIEDEKGQVVFSIVGTKEELDRYLGLFGRNTSNSQIWYDNGKQYGQQPDDEPDNNEERESEEEKKKKDNSWWDGWGAENQGPPW